MSHRPAHLGVIDPDATGNIDHFHVWCWAGNRRYIYKLARGFHTRQVAHKWAKRHKADRICEIKKCRYLKCAPGFD